MWKGARLRLAVESALPRTGSLPERPLEGGAWSLCRRLAQRSAAVPGELRSALSAHMQVAPCTLCPAVTCFLSPAQSTAVKSMLHECISHRAVHPPPLGLSGATVQIERERKRHA